MRAHEQQSDAAAGQRHVGGRQCLFIGGHDGTVRLLHLLAVQQQQSRVVDAGHDEHVVLICGLRRPSVDHRPDAPHLGQVDAGQLLNADAVAHDAQRALLQRITARDQMRLRVVVDHDHVDNGADVGERVDQLHVGRGRLRRLQTVRGAEG